MGGFSFSLAPGEAFGSISTPDQLLAPVPGLTPTSEPGGAGASEIKAGTGGVVNPPSGLPAGTVIPGSGFIQPGGGFAPFGGPSGFDTSQGTFTLPPQNFGSPVQQSIPFPVQGSNLVPGGAFTPTGPDTFNFQGQPITPSPAPANSQFGDIPIPEGISPGGFTFAQSPDQPAQPAQTTTPGATIDPTQIAPGEPEANPPLTDPTTGNFILPPGQAPFLDPQFPTTPGQFSPATLFPSTGQGFFDKLFADIADLFTRFALVVLGAVLLAVATYFLVKGDVPNPVKYFKA